MVPAFRPLTVTPVPLQTYVFRVLASHRPIYDAGRWEARPWLLLLLAASTMAAAAVADRYEASGQREGEIFIDVDQVVDVVLPPRR